MFVTNANKVPEVSKKSTYKKVINATATSLISPPKGNKSLSNPSIETTCLKYSNLASPMPPSLGKSEIYKGWSTACMSSFSGFFVTIIVKCNCSYLRRYYGTS